jgi:prevent-host-death family protein
MANSVAAGRFKDRCLQILDEVATTKTPVIVTKRGRPVAKVVPYVAAEKSDRLAGSIVRETGDPYDTGDDWNADPA